MFQAPLLHCLRNPFSCLPVRAPSAAPPIKEEPGPKPLPIHLPVNPSPNLNWSSRNQILSTTPAGGSMGKWKRSATATGGWSLNQVGGCQWAPTWYGRASAMLKPSKEPTGRWQCSGCPWPTMRLWSGGVPYPHSVSSTSWISYPLQMPPAQGISALRWRRKPWP